MFGHGLDLPSSACPFLSVPEARELETFELPWSVNLVGSFASEIHRETQASSLQRVCQALEGRVPHGASLGHVGQATAARTVFALRAVNETASRKGEFHCGGGEAD